MIFAIIYVATIAVVGGVLLHKEAKKIYKQMDAFLQNAKNAKSLSELENVEAALNKFCLDETWHQNQLKYAREIRQYIRGRIDSYGATRKG